jgi:hypothetical protein
MSFEQALVPDHTHAPETGIDATYYNPPISKDARLYS